MTKKTRLTTADRTKYFIPILKDLMKKHNVTRASPEIVEEANQRALEQANAEIAENDELQAVAPEAKSIFQDLINNHLLDTPITVHQLISDLSALYRGTLFLTQQYSFEDGLVRTLVFNSSSVTGKAADTDTPYTRLKNYGGTTKIDFRKGGHLKQH